MTTRALSITNKLRILIMRGEFPPKAHLQEAPLAVRLGTSRTPVRAAMATLANEGLLLYSPQSGFTVREFTLDDYLEAIGIRAQLEGYAARLAVEKGLTQSQIDYLRTCVATGDRILRTRKLTVEHQQGYRAMNVGFHSTIVAAATSPALVKMVEQTMLIPIIGSIRTLWEKRETLLRTHDDHHRILSAIEGREAWRAEILMREHLYSTNQFIREQLVTALPRFPAGKELRASKRSGASDMATRRASRTARSPESQSKRDSAKREPLVTTALP